jgi:transcriptional regulator
MSNRERIRDLYFIPLLVGLIASALWWLFTRSIISAVVALSTIILATWILWWLTPIWNRVRLAQTSEIAAIFDSQNAAKQEILSHLSTVKSIDILTIRGLGLVGLNDSLLRKPLVRSADRSIVVRILMLDPDCEGASKRAREIGETYEAFRHGVALAKERLRELSDSCPNHRIEVYMYDVDPCWRILRLDNVMYISVFSSGKEGHQSMMYEIKDGQRSGMFEGYSRMFDSMVESAKRIV